MVGTHFKNITGALRSARSVLSSLGNETQLVDKDGNLCNLTCIVGKTKGLLNMSGKTARKSLLKLGLRKSHHFHHHPGLHLMFLPPEHTVR